MKIWVKCTLYETPGGSNMHRSIIAPLIGIGVSRHPFSGTCLRVQFDCGEEWRPMPEDKAQAVVNAFWECASKACDHRTNTNHNALFIDIDALIPR